MAGRLAKQANRAELSPHPGWEGRGAVRAGGTGGLR
jgi:hypothetical protein